MMAFCPVFVWQRSGREDTFSRAVTAGFCPGCLGTAGSSPLPRTGGCGAAVEASSGGHQCDPSGWWEAAWRLEEKPQQPGHAGVRARNLRHMDSSKF